ncbi:hypothetical protein [Marinobacter alexandrii]|uniref:hypothetical protein n=1 Tax=Marinobacter alexandrii TaxID=2570351 RepID=UPI0011093D90|nr:hypothetical protein [Marinobacter alexandrii]
MRKNIERFNAKYAGSYLGDSWVVRASDYEDLEKQLEQAEARVAELERDAPKYEKITFGKDCPIGKVQVEHIGTSGALAHSKYGWNPGSSAFIEIYVDGIRYRVDVGSKDKGKGPVRGLHICGPIGMEVDCYAINACSISAGEKTEQRLRQQADEAEKAGGSDA